MWKSSLRVRLRTVWCCAEGHGDRLVFGATDRPPVTPGPMCNAIMLDIEPWILRGTTATRVIDIAGRLEGSNPFFLGSSLCAGPC